MTPALLGDEQASDLALHPCRYQNRARLGQRLRARGDIRHVAENLAFCIDHDRSRLDGDARGKRGLARAFVLAVQFNERTLNRERRPHRAFGIILLRHRIAKQRHQSIAQFLGDLAAHFHYRRRSRVEIGTDQVAPLLGIELGGNAGRTHQIAEHNR